MKIEKSPTKTVLSQNNHIFLCVCGFIKLEKLSKNYKCNHFSLKEKIYINALQVAFEKVRSLKVA